MRLAAAATFTCAVAFAVGGDAFADPTPPPAPTSIAGASATRSGPREEWVRLRDRKVFAIRAAAGRSSKVARAAAVSQSLDRALAAGGDLTVNVDAQGGVAIVYAGRTPVVQLRPEDAQLAGDTSLEVHAAMVAAQIEAALVEERRRSHVAGTVFSLSLIVFSGLIAFLLLRRTGEVAERLRRWLSVHPKKLPAFRVGGVEMISPVASAGLLRGAIAIGHRVIQIVAVYLWLLFSFSLFDATRGLTERLTDMALSPLAELLGRLVAALPVFVAGTIALIVVAVLVRFTGLFFGSVSRGETTLSWLSADLAEPTGVLVRFGIIVAALLFAAPAITPLAVLLALGLATVPILASAAAGVLAIYGRRLQPGDQVDIGGQTGRVRATNLLEVVLEDSNGHEVRIPHLFMLLRPRRTLPSHAPLRIEVSIDPLAPQARVREILLDAGRAAGKDPRVELVSLSADGACWVVTGFPVAGADPAALFALVADRLAAEGVALGRGHVRGDG